VALGRGVAFHDSKQKQCQHRQIMMPALSGNVDAPIEATNAVQETSGS
jgi:hypothetical protein